MMPRDPSWDLEKARPMDRSLAKPMDLHWAALKVSKLEHQRVYHWVIHLDWRMAL